MNRISHGDAVFQECRGIFANGCLYLHTGKLVLAKNRISINWEGSLFVHHSLGMVNREIIAELTGSSIADIKHIPYEPDCFTPPADSKFASLTALRGEPHAFADVHVRHKWPPDFNRPPCGKFVLMQPWEYGSLPVDWIKPMNEIVDEIWVYTKYLKKCYEHSGIREEKVKVVPLGIDPTLFNSSAPPHAPIADLCKKGCYRFLYNGGVNTRKGTDILVNAYLSEFTADEPVCLIIKDSNAYTKKMSEKIKALSGRNDIATLLYTCEDIPHESLPGLYTASDCYVHPYRAEGYGLPIVEAMACAIPVIVTGGGACLDFVLPDDGFFIKCVIEKMATRVVGDLKTVDTPFWLVPDVDHLRSLMRYVFNNRKKAEKIGKAAGERVRSAHTWKETAGIIEDFLVRLSGSQGYESSVAPQNESFNKDIDTAITLIAACDFDNASNVLQKILLRHGESSIVYEGLAIAAFYKKNYIEACNLFSAAHRISETSPDIIINWYEAAKCSGLVHQLVEPVMKALPMNSGNDELRAIALEMGIL